MATKFEKKFNYNNVFIRSMVLGVMNEFYRKVRWFNTWDDKEKLITVPVFYGLVGDERFMIDLFVDDITGKRVELNIDPIPRAHIEWQNSIIKRSEYANPNVNVVYYKEENGILKKLQGKMKFLPIKTTFKIKIWLSKEIEMMKCQESLWEFFFAYKYFFITHNSIRLDCILDVPDEKAIDINREIAGISGKNDTDKFIEFDFDVHSYFPIEPKETPPIVATNCNRVLFKGNTRKLSLTNIKKTFLGSNINKKDCEK